MFRFMTIFISFVFFNTNEKEIYFFFFLQFFFFFFFFDIFFFFFFFQEFHSLLEDSPFPPTQVFTWSVDSSLSPSSSYKVLSLFLSFSSLPFSTHTHISLSMHIHKLSLFSSLFSLPSSLFSLLSSLFSLLPSSFSSRWERHL